MRVVGGIQGKLRYYEFQQWGAGTVMVPGSNPEAEEVPQELLEGIVIDPRTPILDSDNCTAVAKFFIWALENCPGNGSGFRGQPVANNEAGVLLAVAEDCSHCIVGVSRQVIGGARVTMDRSNGAINILTGEVYPHWPPDGYVENGDIHSHNTMGAFFSGQDDRDDAGIPGRHLVFGKFHMDNGGIYHWDIATSIVVNFTRYRKATSQQGEVRDMVFADLIDMTWTKANVHKDVYQRVSMHEPEGFAAASTGFRVPMGKAQQYQLAPYLSEDDKYEARIRDKMQDWHDRKKEDFPKDFDWLHDILHPPVKEHPGQTQFWGKGNEESVFDSEDEENWCVHYMRMEIEAVLDGFDAILHLAPDKKTGAEIIKQVVQSTGLFKKRKKGAKKK